MITDDRINNKNANPPNYLDSYKLKDLKAATGVSSSAFSGYDTNTNLAKDLEDQAKSMGNDLANNSKEALNAALNGLQGLSGRLAFKMPEFGSEPVNGDDNDDSIIKQLISLIMGVINLPMRFVNMSQALMNGTVALATGIEGLAKSAILGTKDIITLIIALIKVVSKYFVCILSFVITTFAGCFLIHAITFMFYVMYLIFPVSGYLVQQTTGYDMMPDVESTFEMLDQVDEQVGQYTGGLYILKWPSVIQNICYTCFGQKVKMRDVLVDVEIIKDIGDTIAYDFTKVMPVYMRPSKPHAATALRHLDAAFN